MAYSICSSPSITTPDHHHFFSVPPPPRLFPPKPFTTPFTKKPLQVSLQTHSSQVVHKDGTTGSSFSSHIWVNPKSTKASELRKKSYDSKYNSLVKISLSLDSCLPIEADVQKILVDGLGPKIVEQDAVVILNNMSNSQTAPFVLKYFQDNLDVSRDVVLYNVCLKVFRKAKDLVGTEKLFDEMLHRGVQPDVVTFSTVIGCCRLCSLPSKAVEWYEKMPSFGLEPDAITSVVMIDAYGRAGNVKMALSLYDRARSEKWPVRTVTYATVIRIYGVAGNYDGCLNVYEEMKALGVKPNGVLYNNLLDAMGRAKRPWHAKNIYKEMINNGLLPGWLTYSALLRAYGRSRYGEDAMIVYREMKGKGFELNTSLYNTLLAMCADLGYVEEGVEIYEDMKKGGSCQPDSFTFSSLITIYSCCGKLTEVEATLNEMKNMGLEPTLFIFTSLIQCYGKANRTDDIVKTIDQILEQGMTPDERFCCCLLSVMTQTPTEELGKLTECLEKANSKLGHVVNLLVQGVNVEEQIFKKEAHDLLDSVTADVKKPYCNCLIDLCVNLDLLDRACLLLDLGLTLKIYSDLQSKVPTQWSLNLKSLSAGAALTAINIWMSDLSKAVEEGEELPSVLGINTGHGKHRYTGKGLVGLCESLLKELNAPFHEAADRPGWFFTTKDAAKSWLESHRSTIL